MKIRDYETWGWEGCSSWYCFVVLTSVVVLTHSLTVLTNCVIVLTDIVIVLNSIVTGPGTGQAEAPGTEAAVTAAAWGSGVGFLVSTTPLLVSTITILVSAKALLVSGQTLLVGTIQDEVAHAAAVWGFGFRAWGVALRAWWG